MNIFKQTVKNLEISGDRQLKLDLDHKVKPGTEFRITGALLSTDPSLVLLPPSDTHNIHTPLHFNPRFGSSTDHGSGRNGNVIVINAKINDEWTEESLVFPKPFPFEARKSFDIQIKCEEEQFRISANGNVIAVFEYRLPVDIVNKMFIRGQLKLSLVEIMY